MCDLWCKSIGNVSRCTAILVLFVSFWSAAVIYGQDHYDYLKQSFKSSDHERATQGMDSLGIEALADMVDSLAMWLGDEDKDVRWYSMVALTRIGAPAVDALIGALSHENPDARVRAADGLARIKDSRAVDRLIATLKGDQDEWVRYRCAGALGAIGDSRALDALIEAIADESYKVRGSAALPHST